MSDLRVDIEPASPMAGRQQPDVANNLAAPGALGVVPAWDLLRLGGALFLSPAHLSVLESLVASLLGGAPLVALTGPDGVGKTTLVEAAVPLLAERSVRVIRIENPDRAPLSLDRLLAGVIGTPDSVTLSEEDAGRACEVLLFPPDGQRATVVVIDQAQTLEPDALRMLGMVTNQAGPSGHKVQILFVALNVFFDTMRDEAPSGLLARITPRLAMEPYSEQDARAFIEHRLGLPGDGKVAGLSLSDDALRAILRHGGGLPGRIGDGLDAVLAAARRRGQRRVTARTARRALEARPRPGSPRQPLLARLGALLGLAVLLAVLLVGGSVGVSRLGLLRHESLADLGKAAVHVATEWVSLAKASWVGTATPSWVGALDSSVGPAASGRLTSVSGAAAERPAAGIASPAPPRAAALEPAANQPSAAGRESHPAQPPAGDQAATLLPESVRTVLKQRGDGMLAVGDVAAARRLYERAAEAGSGEAATAAGKTYDPAVLALIGAVGISPDRDAAARWYGRAIALGDPDAARWLKQLGATAH